VGENGPDVSRLRALVIAGGGVQGAAHAAQVRHHHGVVPREIRRQGRPHVASVAEAVEQHDRWPLLAGPEMNHHRVIRRDRLPLEVARERCDLRGCAPREGESCKGPDQNFEHGSSPPMIRPMCPDTLIGGHGSGHPHQRSTIDDENAL
jgi:hypothetical protein